MMRRQPLHIHISTLFIALIIGLGFVPSIPLGAVEVNLGGCVVPL